LPIGFCVLLVASRLPSSDFIGQGLFVGNAPIETLSREDAEFGFGHIQPTAVFGCIVPFEPLDQPSGFLGRKGFVERSGLVGVEIVLHEHDLLGFWEAAVRYILEDFGIVDGGMLVRDFDVPLTLQGREHHEQIGRAVACIFVIVSFRMSGRRWNSSARLNSELL
jgi:hypothetical protein